MKHYTTTAAPASCEVRTKKMMATLFSDRKGILLTEFMAPGTTITSEVYCETLKKLRRSIQSKRCGMLTEGVVLLHDNARKPRLAQML